MPTLQIEHAPTLPHASPMITDEPAVTQRLKPRKLPQHEPGLQNTPASMLQSNEGKPPSGSNVPASERSSRHWPALVSQLLAHETHAVPAVPLPH